MTATPAGLKIGARFGRLTVQSTHLRATPESYAKQQRLSVAICRCDCGAISTVKCAALKSGNTKSCGCWARVHNVTHGHTRSGMSPEYRTWRSMKARCSNPNHTSFPQYGGRGISVCAEWRDSFDAFFYDIGARPAGTTLDRIDNSLGYEPGNCRWATASVQQRNQRKRRGTASQYVGVVKHGRHWAAQVKRNACRLYFRSFATELEAARARDAFVRANGIASPLNFPEAS